MELRLSHVDEVWDWTLALDSFDENVKSVWNLKWKLRLSRWLVRGKKDPWMGTGMFNFGTKIRWINDCDRTTIEISMLFGMEIYPSNKSYN